jgi:serine O-acetyltransferase
MMIRSYDDYLGYLEADRIALNRKGFKDRFTNDIWRYQRLLRKCEYYRNCKCNSLFGKIFKTILGFQRNKLGTRLSFTIPENTCGPGLRLAHKGTIVINDHARIGANCTIHVCVSIATSAGTEFSAPTIGDNCYIGPGAKIFGSVIIGPNTAIGANSVVKDSFIEGNCTIGGIPAKVVSQKTSKDYIHVAWPLNKIDVVPYSTIPDVAKVSSDTP